MPRSELSSPWNGPPINFKKETPDVAASTTTSAPAPKVRPAPSDVTDDPFAAFAAEVRTTAQHVLEVERRSRAQRRALFFTAAVIVGTVIGGLVTAVVLRSGGPDDAASRTSVVKEAAASITSSPAGGQVLIDNVIYGITPLSLSLPVGEHAVEIRNGAASRAFSIQVEAGKIVSQHVDFGATPTTSRLEVASDPPGTEVSIDGVPRGKTPLTVAEISPGQHRVAIAIDRGTVNRMVTLKPGETASVVVSLTSGGTTTGWVSIETPFETQVFEG